MTNCCICHKLVPHKRAKHNAKTCGKECARILTRSHNRKCQQRLAQNSEFLAAEAVRMRQYRKDHPERTTAAVRKYRAANKDVVYACIERWCKKNPEKVAAYARKSYQNRKAKLLENANID